MKIILGIFKGYFLISRKILIPEYNEYNYPQSHFGKVQEVTQEDPNYTTPSP